MSTKNAILRTVDGGEHFEVLPIVSPNDIEILSLAVNEANPEAIYYGTTTTFYASGNSGKGWSTKKLPSTRSASAMIVDSEAPNIIYLGVAKPKR